MTLVKLDDVKEMLKHKCFSGSLAVRLMDEADKLPTVATCTLATCVITDKIDEKFLPEEERESCVREEIAMRMMRTLARDGSIRITKQPDEFGNTRYTGELTMVFPKEESDAGN